MHNFSSIVDYSNFRNYVYVFEETVAGYKD